MPRPVLLWMHLQWQENLTWFSLSTIMGKGNGNPADVLLTLLDNLGFTDNYIECMIPTSDPIEQPMINPSAPNVTFCIDPDYEERKLFSPNLHCQRF